MRRIQVKQATSIDSVDLKNERLLVHGRNLIDIIRKYNYIESIYHILTGEFPTKFIVGKFNKIFLLIAKTFLKNKELNEIIFPLTKLSISCEEFIICALSILPEMQNDIISQEILRIFNKKGTSDIKQIISTIYFIAIVPILIGFLNKVKSNYILTILNDSKDFINFFYEVAACRRPNVKEVFIFNRLLVSLHAGFGVVAPTILIPRLSASTYAPIKMNLIAGFAACGKAHVGACSEAMKLFKKLGHITNNNLLEDCLLQIINAEKIPGFGHPLLERDPRNKILEKLVSNKLNHLKYFELYLGAKSILFRKKRLRPNIDSIAAAILLDLGISEQLGTVIFLFSRMATIAAHAIQKKSMPPFGFKKKDARKKFAKFPFNWV